MIAVSEYYRRPLRFGLLLQTGIVILSALTLDFGSLAWEALIALVVFWIGALLILLRRPANPTQGDLWYLRLGFLALAVAVHVSAHFLWDRRA